MINTIYFIGAPATGKTTLMKNIHQEWLFMENVSKPIAYRVFKDLTNKENEYNIVLGKDAPVYGGTDTLSFTAINHCEDLYKKFSRKRVKYVLAEGDRLANSTFFDMCLNYGELHVI